jgi:uncharacterized protein YodC (DUF2158 family)
MRTTDKLLAGILSALVLLVAAVVSLSVVIYVSSRPTPAPTGPSRHVTVTALADGVVGEVVLTDASGVTTMQLRGEIDRPDSTSWERDVAFGEGVDLRMVITERATDDDGIEFSGGSIRCKILDGSGTLATTTLNLVGGSGSCRWVNGGK